MKHFKTRKDKIKFLKNIQSASIVLNIHVPDYSKLSIPERKQILSIMRNHGLKFFDKSDMFLLNKDEQKFFTGVLKKLDYEAT